MINLYVTRLINNNNKYSFKKKTFRETNSINICSVYHCSYIIYKRYPPCDYKESFG